MWLVYCLIASIFWGLDYALTERVLKHISFPLLISIELLFGFIVMMTLIGFSKTAHEDIATILKSKQLILLIICITLSFAIANTFIVLSIEAKGATIAGLIEISYPLFIVFFSWLLFKENTLSIATAIGGGLIFIGVSIIYLFNK